MNLGYNSEKIKNIIEEVNSDIDNIFQEIADLAENSKAKMMIIFDQKLKQYISDKMTDWNYKK
ncbi:MAG: hypothetical protein K9L86_06705 [Candidatus Omnitrophica bacterium]|nr:hypothetical protein [Candidatus Omnitrophota bacterium]